MQILTGKGSFRPLGKLCKHALLIQFSLLLQTGSEPRPPLAPLNPTHLRKRFPTSWGAQMKWGEGLPGACSRARAAGVVSAVWPQTSRAHSLSFRLLICKMRTYWEALICHQE